MQIAANAKTSLAELQIGESAVIEQLLCDEYLRRRLNDLGLVPGTRVAVTVRSPLGDPIAIEARGAVIAIRREDAEQILVKLEAANGTS